MRLLIRSLPHLNKAGKQGLVAVKKPVTKKGKTFMQTFYVKPDTVPKSPNGPVAVADTMLPLSVSTLEGDSFPSNRPEGGLYLRLADAAIRVPEKYIIKTAEIHGRTFVIHRAMRDLSGPGQDPDYLWSGKYRATELESGVSAGMGDTPEGAEEEAMVQIERVGAERLEELIASHGPVTDVAKVIMDTDDFPSEEPIHMLTDVEFDEFAEKVWTENLEGANGPLELSQVKEWLKTMENIESNKDVEIFFNGLPGEETYFTMERAVLNNRTYSEEEDYMSAVEDLISVVSESDQFQETFFDFESIEEWLEKTNTDPTDIHAYSYGVNYESGDEAWSSADVIAYAISQEMSLNDAQSLVEEMVSEEEAEIREETNVFIDFTDFYGTKWDGEELEQLGHWVGGMVQTTRKATTDLDEKRRQGCDTCETDNTIASVLESHAKQYTEGMLFRGTGNPAWLEGKIGDTVMVGIASYSKSKSAAQGFASKVLLIVESSEAMPVMGLDVDKLISVGGNSVEVSNAISATGVAAYVHEREVILRAPAFEIVNRDGNVVTVRPTEMELLDVMKALFEDRSERVKAMERTFDHSMRDEVDMVWD